MEDRPLKTIADLPQLVESLSPAKQELFRRIFHVSTVVGHLKPPPSMHRWIESHFGSVEAVLAQRIVKVTNLVTWEGSLFNELRAERPMEARENEDIKKLIMENYGDPFCRPLEETPEDVFGRVRGKYSVTCSNIAKYDGFHGLVIFDEHDPLVFSAERVSDYIDTALAWAQEAHEVDPEARYFFLMWNCLWKSGASIIHGHTQMTLGREMHYAKVEHLRRAAKGYEKTYGSNYFDDLYEVHSALGLGLEAGRTRLLAYLTPIKEKEVLFISQPRWEHHGLGSNGKLRLDEDLKVAIYKVLRCFVDRLGVRSFNLAFCMPPIIEAGEDWSGFPVIVRLVDRGSLINKTADFGGMELYAASVVASDPFRLAEVLRTSL